MDGCKMRLKNLFMTIYVTGYYAGYISCSTVEYLVILVNTCDTLILFGNTDYTTACPRWPLFSFLLYIIYSSCYFWSTHCVSGAVLGTKYKAVTEITDPK